MGCVLEEGEETAPRRDKRAFCRSVAWLLGPDTLEEMDAAFPDAGVAGPEVGCSWGP